MKKYKRYKDYGLEDQDIRLSKLSKAPGGCPPYYDDRVEYQINDRMSFMRFL
jgi:hypothetical protein